MHHDCTHNIIYDLNVITFRRILFEWRLLHIVLKRACLLTCAASNKPICRAWMFNRTFYEYKCLNSSKFKFGDHAEKTASVLVYAIIIVIKKSVDKLTLFKRSRNITVTGKSTENEWNEPFFVLIVVNEIRSSIPTRTSFVYYFPYNLKVKKK